MPGLVPGIHVLCAAWKGVDGRDRPGHDVVGTVGAHSHISYAIALRLRGQGSPEGRWWFDSRRDDEFGTLLSSPSRSASATAAA
ncbi:hypothetical protein XH96_37380 [Bradyrhizobium sp. CCBAU 51765]|nr:hypothetical protein XH96_37380 [Bradyrhizobium sp. CCBAU 51765]